MHMQKYMHMLYIRSKLFHVKICYPDFDITIITIVHVVAILKQNIARSCMYSSTCTHCTNAKVDSLNLHRNALIL